MFILVDFEYNHQLDCVHASENIDEILDATTVNAEETFTDSVLPDVGLIVTVVKVKDIKLLPMIDVNNGKIAFKVLLQVVAFNPQPNTILVATITNIGCYGISLNIGSFFDIKVNTNWLFTNSQYDADYNCYVWKYDENTELMYNVGDICRIRVLKVIFNRINNNNITNNSIQDESAMSVTAAMNVPGLGPLKWW